MISVKKPLYYPVIGIFLVVIILIAGLGYYTLRNLHREEQLMYQHLTNVGLAIMNALESSAAVGMMGMSWQQRQLQSLVKKIGQQSNIEYLYLVDEKSEIVLSSIPSAIGTSLSEPPLDFNALTTDSAEVALTVAQGKKQVFELRKQFKSPGAGMHMPMMSRHMRQMGMASDLSPPLAIVLGLRMEGYRAAVQEDTRRALGSGIVLVILALASTFFAFVIHKYYGANKALTEAQSFIGHVIESMGHGLVALDASGNILTINKKGCELLQQESDSVQGRPFEEVMQDVECSIDKSEILQKEWTEKKMRCSIKGSSSSLPISFTSRQIRGQEGAFMGTVMLMRDLQEIETLEEKVKRSERLASLGQMAAGIAHEIRNPLGSIKGLAQYFARKFEQEPEEQKYAEAIIGESDRLNRVIRDLLNFARPQEPTYQSCDVMEIINHALALVKADLEAKQIAVERTGEASVPTFDADPDLLAQALMNLFLNAIEAMNESGRLSIRCRYHESNQKVEIEITDNGTGIPPSDLPKVFDPFFTSKKGGTGLGLALVLRIIENHGGSIDVRSQVGEGTNFTILLPKKP